MTFPASCHWRAMKMSISQKSEQLVSRFNILEGDRE